MAAQFWRDYLDLDVTRKEDKRVEGLVELELKKFGESAFGFGRAASSTTTFSPCTCAKNNQQLPILQI